MTRVVMQLVRMHVVSADELPFVAPGHPGYVSCRAVEPGDYCGGCDMCLAMQYGHYGGTPPGGREEYDANVHAHYDV